MTEPRIRLCLVLHNHQPIGNFDDVIEQAYVESYLPFLDVFESFPQLHLSLHISGPLAVWLEQHHSEYLDRLAALVEKDRVEILGGAFYEPILTMIPGRDRVGQIRHYSDWLSSRFQTSVLGMWIPERVWEASLVGDLVNAGIEYTVLDDFHFLASGLESDQLLGDFVTEEQCELLRIFPGSEKLRYTIPFRQPKDTIEHLRQVAHKHPDSTIVFADDGEKFGTWPETHKLCYEEGWLREFFELLVENQNWISTSTLWESIKSSAPIGKVYLPACSYREMTEWSLPVERQIQLHDAAKSMQDDYRWETLQQFVRGGFWRNFRVKYSEANEMYSRMMNVSQRLQKTIEQFGEHQLTDQARDHLYRGQCNCSYWHGAFGGVYLPHLRNAVFHQLIQADNLIDQADGKNEPFIEAVAEDFDFDTRREIRLANDRLITWIKPSAGGHIYELDIRSIAHNLLATMNRRPEAYHDAIREHGQKQNDEDDSDEGSEQGDEAASIHDRIKFKQAGLDEKLVYDRTSRKSLVDHFWPSDVDPASIANDTAEDLGDFATGQYQSTIRRSEKRHQILLSRYAEVDSHRIKLTKGITLSKGSDEIEIAYLLEELPEDETLHLGIEFNFAGMPDGADDRFFEDSNGKSLGQLGTDLDLSACSQIALIDQWLDLHAKLSWDIPGGLWTFPVQTVSQSEDGFELVHQSVVVQPHWHVRGDVNHRWAVKLNLSLNTPNHQPENDETSEAIAMTGE